MAELHIRILFGNADDGLSPQAGGFQHVGLVHAAQLVAALLSHFKSHTGNALDFRHRIFFRIKSGGLAVFFAASPLSEVNAAGQLTNHQHVDALADNLRLQRRSFPQGFKNHGRAQVCKQAQRGADAQQALFGAVAAGLGVPLGAAHSTQQGSVCVFADGDCLFRQGHTGGVDSSAAQQGFLIVHGKTKLFTGFVQHFLCLFYDFRADSVAL